LAGAELCSLLVAIVDVDVDDGDGDVGPRHQKSVRVAPARPDRFQGWGKNCPLFCISMWVDTDDDDDERIKRE